jgi:hypothetical protein
MLIEMIKEVQKDIREIKDNQSEASISIATIKAMQEAIDKLNLDKRLREVELKQSQDKGNKDSSSWLITTGIAASGVIIALVALFSKH